MIFRRVASDQFSIMDGGLGQLGNAMLMASMMSGGGGGGKGARTGVGYFPKGGGPNMQAKAVCRAFAATGRCSYGDGCRFVHEKEGGGGADAAAE